MKRNTLLKLYIYPILIIVMILPAIIYYGYYYQNKSNYCTAKGNECIYKTINMLNGARYSVNARLPYDVFMFLKPQFDILHSRHVKIRVIVETNGKQVLFVPDSLLNFSYPVSVITKKAKDIQHYIIIDKHRVVSNKVISSSIVYGDGGVITTITDLPYAHDVLNIFNHSWAFSTPIFVYCHKHTCKKPKSKSWNLNTVK